MNSWLSFFNTTDGNWWQRDLEGKRDFLSNNETMIKRKPSQQQQHYSKDINRVDKHDSNHAIGRLSSYSTYNTLQTYIQIDKHLLLIYIYEQIHITDCSL